MFNFVVILKELIHHKSIFSGHFGIIKTLAKLKQKKLLGNNDKSPQHVLTYVSCQ